MSLNPQKVFTAQKTSNLRDWNPKILKICELKSPEPYTGKKTLQIYELHTSKSYKRQALTLCELEGPKNAQEAPSKTMSLKHSISYKRETLQINELETPKSYKRTRLKPMSLNP